MTDEPQDQRTASCSCGEVTVTVSGPPAFSAICCCRDCQSRSGSAFGLSAYYAVEKVIARTGTPTTYRRISDKHRYLDFRFCPTCGTTVWWEAEFLPGKIGIAGALFGDLENFRPDGAYFCATKPDFVQIDAAVPQGLGATTGS